ncbi:hypothetical protein QQZ08_001342 [Neonectria magnoliae]|uniref:Cytochrome P450 n=1 Tax=Neonectria magnoliae TaxID=2732573 RepID=A0ABR1IGB4_9HYPO
MEVVQMLLRGLETYSGIFQVMSDTGPLVVLPNRFADEVCNNKSLSFNRYFDKDFFVNYPGFEAYHTGYKDGTFIQEIVRVKFTQSLALVNKGLVEETTNAIRNIIGGDTNFHEIPAEESTSALVARLSSRVFLSRGSARNKPWLEIAVDYIHDSCSAAYELGGWPFFLRPFVYWFLPKCYRPRQEVRDATTLIMPEVESRKKAAQEALTAGKKPPKKAGTIGWIHEFSRGRDVKYVHGQLFLSFAAIHTTAETITGCLYDICAYPKVVQPLRKEIIQVLGESEWSKTALYKLQLMDSLEGESTPSPHGILSVSD